MTSKQDPSIRWDGETWFVTLPIEGQVIEAKWNPGLTYVVRTREVGTEDWSVGFETPLTNCKIVDLKPDTEYEIKLCAKNSVGESEPSYARARTDAEGIASNIIPFPVPEC